MILKSSILILAFLATAASAASNSYNNPFNQAQNSQAQFAFNNNHQAPFLSASQLYSMLPQFDATSSYLSSIAQTPFYQSNHQQQQQYRHLFSLPSNQVFNQSPLTQQSSKISSHSANPTVRQQQVPNPFHLSTAQIYGENRHQQPTQFAPEISSRKSLPIHKSPSTNQGDSGEKNLLSSVQVIDTQGNLRSLREFGLGGSGSEVNEPELERQLMSIFETIKKDLEDADFFPLDMNGAGSPTGFIQQTVQRSPEASKQQEANRIPIEVATKQTRQLPAAVGRGADLAAGQFQFLRPVREQQRNKFHQMIAPIEQPLRSPAQALRASDKKFPFEGQQQQQQQQIFEENLNQVKVEQRVTPIKAPAQLFREQELKVRQQQLQLQQAADQQIKNLDSKSRRQQESRGGQYSTPVEQSIEQQQAIRVPADSDRKQAIQVQAPIEQQQQQQQQQLGFDDELPAIPKVVNSELSPSTPTREPSFSEQTQIGLKQARIEQQQQQFIGRGSINEQAPIVQEPEQQQQQQQQRPLELDSDRQQQSQVGAPSLPAGKQTQQDSLGWRPIVQAGQVQVNVIGDQKRELTDQLQSNTLREINEQQSRRQTDEQFYSQQQKFKSQLELKDTQEGQQKTSFFKTTQQQPFQVVEEQRQKIDFKQEQGDKFRPVTRPTLPIKGIRLNKPKKSTSSFTVNHMSAKSLLTNLANSPALLQQEPYQGQQQQQQQQQLQNTPVHQSVNSFSEFEQQKHEEIPASFKQVDSQQKHEEALSEALEHQRQILAQQSGESGKIEQQSQNEDFNVQQTTASDISSTSRTATTTTTPVSTSTNVPDTTTTAVLTPRQNLRAAQIRKVKLQPVENKRRGIEAKVARQQQAPESPSEAKRSRRVQQQQPSTQQERPTSSKQGQRNQIAITQTQKSKTTKKGNSRPQDSRKQQQIVAGVTQSSSVDSFEQQQQQLNEPDNQQAQQPVSQEFNQQVEIKQETPVFIQEEIQSKLPDDISQMKEEKQFDLKEETQKNEQLPESDISQQTERPILPREEVFVNQNAFQQQKEDSTSSSGQLKEEPVISQQQDSLESSTRSLLDTEASSSPQEPISQATEATPVQVTGPQKGIADEQHQQQVQLQPEELTQQKDSVQESWNEPASQQQEVSTDAPAQEQQQQQQQQEEASSPQPQIVQLDQEQKQEPISQDGLQQVQVRETDSPMKLDDSAQEVVSQETQQVTTTTTESQPLETKAVEEPLPITSTARPPTRIARLNLRKDTISASYAQKGVEGRQKPALERKVSFPRLRGKAEQANQKSDTQKEESYINKNINQREQKVTNDATKNTLNAQQFINTFNPLQFEPERISSLSKGTENLYQNTNVNASPLADSY